MIWFYAFKNVLDKGYTLVPLFGDAWVDCRLVAVLYDGFKRRLYVLLLSDACIGGNILSSSENFFYSMVFDFSPLLRAVGRWEGAESFPYGIFVGRPYGASHRPPNAAPKNRHLMRKSKFVREDVSSNPRCFPKVEGQIPQRSIEALWRISFRSTWRMSFLSTLTHVFSKHFDACLF